MDTVRIGVIGVGGMGGHHTACLKNVTGATLTALCDVNPAKREKLKEKYNVPVFETHQELLSSGLVDAVIIATPHYDHPIITLAAFAKGIHVLSEKPVAVSVKAARQVNEAYLSKYKHLKFALMFQMRTGAVNRKIHSLIAEGELGEITRITWICTDWYRTWTYYASGGWRATWSGEGGGVLLNQCPHNMDQLQWLIGMVPTRVTAIANIAKRHPIEVEDEVSAMMEYSNGAIGHFITTTGEAPGSNRLEIVGENGSLIAENNKLHFRRLRANITKHLQTSPQSFDKPECWDIEVPCPVTMPETHQTVIQRFVDVILKNEPNENQIAPGTEGVKGLEIGNAMLMSGVTRKPVDLPLDGDAYEALLKDLTVKYGGKKTLQTKNVQADMGSSFKLQ